MTNQMNHSDHEYIRTIFSDTLLSVQKKKNILSFTGSIFLADDEINKVELALVGQRSGHTSLYSISFDYIDQTTQTHNEYQWHWHLNVQKLIKKILIEHRGVDVFSVRLLIHTRNRQAPLVLSVSLPGVYTMAYFKEVVAHYGKTSGLIASSVSSEGFLELTVSFIDKEVFEKNQKYSLAEIFETRKQDRPVWLIGHKADSLGENSWTFFQHVLQTLTEIDVFYILDPSAPEWHMAKKIAGSNLLAFHSKEYFNYLKVADRLICEALPYHLYPSMSPTWDAQVKAKKTILPAYPLGLDNGRWTVNKHFVPWEIDHLVVSSKPEKRYAIETLGYADDKVLLTGLASQTLLDQQDGEEENLVLLVPLLKQNKWHSQNQRRQDPLLQLVQEDPFQDWLKTNMLDLCVLLTEADEELKEAYQACGVKTKTVELFEKQMWLKKARLLITDAHPLALEFAWLERPIVFYQIDSNQTDLSISHDEKERVYQNELPGEVAESVDQVVHLLTQISNDDFEMSRRNRMKARALFEFDSGGENDRLLEYFNPETP